MSCLASLIWDRKGICLSDLGLLYIIYYIYTKRRDTLPKEETAFFCLSLWHDHMDSAPRGGRERFDALPIL